MTLALFQNRRVVTGFDEEGRGTVLYDGPVPQFGHEANTAVIWRTDSQPADNAGNDDAATPFHLDLLKTPGSTFAIFTIPPRTPLCLHATATVDYIAILSGQATLVLEAEEVSLGAGDLIVDRGVTHGWRNDADEPCIAVGISLPAHPLYSETLL